VRTCADCRAFVLGDNGEVSTYYGLDAAGTRVELPMARDAGDPPPCTVCPKIPDGAPKSWEWADEFDDWFWDARAWWRECRAVGDFAGPDPLMRGVAAEFDAADRLAAEERAANRFANLLRR
jgi:hypothetical protein